MRSRRQQSEPGYSNQSARPIEEPAQRYTHVPELCWTDEVRDFYQRAEMQRMPGEARLDWLERTRRERDRIGLGQGHVAAVAPPKEQARNLRLEFGPGVDDDSV